MGTELLLGETCAEIAVRTGETVTVATRVGDRAVVYVHAEPSAFEVCYRSRLRERRPILPTSAGKLFLAADDERESTLALAGENDRRRYRDEIGAIHETGMAFNRGETVSDLGAVTVHRTVRSRRGMPHTPVH